MDNKTKRVHLAFGIATLLVLCVIFSNFSKEENTTKQTTSQTSSRKAEYSTTSTSSPTNSNVKEDSDTGATSAPLDSAETDAPKKEKNKKKTKKQNKNSASTKTIYLYLKNLLESDENPYNWVDTGDDLEAWQKACDEYEKNATKKTAKKFGLTVKQVDKIYSDEVLANLNLD